MTNTTNNQFTVTGLFKDKKSAECAYNALSTRGYDKDGADVVMSDQTRDKYYSGADAEDTELGSKALEGSGTGAAIGGTLGAIIAGIAAIGTSVLLPGLGLIVAGPLAAALVGAGAGGLAGGLVGALIGAGIPEEHAAAYEEGVKSGGIVIRATPRTAEDANFIENKFKSCGGEQVYSNAAQQTTTTARAVATDMSQQRDSNTGEVTIPVIQEELNVGKRTVDNGGVSVKTTVTERPVEETIRLRDENVTVDRRAVDRDVTDADMSAVKDGNFTITERDEEAVVGKTARVVEEVVVGKTATDRTETINETVKRTDVDVQNLDKNKS